MDDPERGRPPRKQRLDGKAKQPSQHRGQKPAKGCGKPRRPWG